MNTADKSPGTVSRATNRIVKVLIKEYPGLCADRDIIKFASLGRLSKKVITGCIDMI
jgi:hypothetical protein